MRWWALISCISCEGELEMSATPWWKTLAVATQVVVWGERPQMEKVSMTISCLLNIPSWTWSHSVSSLKQFVHLERDDRNLRCNLDEGLSASLLLLLHFICTLQLSLPSVSAHKARLYMSECFKGMFISFFSTSVELLKTLKSHNFVKGCTFRRRWAGSPASGAHGFILPAYGLAGRSLRYMDFVISIILATSSSESKTLNAVNSWNLKFLLWY